MRVLGVQEPAKSGGGADLDHVGDEADTQSLAAVGRQNEYIREIGDGDAVGDGAAEGGEVAVGVVSRHYAPGAVDALRDLLCGPPLSPVGVGKQELADGWPV